MLLIIAIIIIMMTTIIIMIMIVGGHEISLATFGWQVKIFWEVRIIGWQLEGFGDWFGKLGLRVFEVRGLRIGRSSWGLRSHTCSSLCDGTLAAKVRALVGFCWAPRALTKFQQKSKWGTQLSIEAIKLKMRTWRLIFRGRNLFEKLTKSSKIAINDFEYN